MPVYKNESAKKNPWFFQFYTGEIVQGVRKRIFKRGYKTKKAAEKAMVEAQNAVHKGDYIEHQKLLFKDYLKDWIHNKNDIGEATKELYESYLRVHLIPDLGNIMLEKLTPMMIQNFISNLYDKGLADNTVKRIFSVLNAALNQAVKMDIIMKNAASKISKPKVQRRDLKIWDVEEVNTFLSSITQESRYSIAIYLAVMTGMRQGEILGLRWSDVDLENRIVHIQQTLSRDGKTLRSGAKTAGSVRSVAISHDTVNALKEYRNIMIQERLQQETDYINHDLVICTAKGTPASTRTIYKVWNRLIEKYNAPKITFHDLRHTHASLMLRQGIHPKIVSERLGHSSVNITLDTYSHLLPNMQEDAADGLDSIIKVTARTQT